MSNTYTWSFYALEAYPTHEGQTDVVFTVHWRLMGDDGNGNVGDVYGSQAITFDPETPFTPYADLQPAQVQGWVEAAMGEERLDGYKAVVDQKIAEMANPTSVTLPPPWAIAVEEPAPVEPAAPVEQV